MTAAAEVGILLELARIMAAETPPVGVDIVLFDGEDYGHTTDIDKYFLGSRHWASNPPVAGYNPRFGILLDIGLQRRSHLSQRRVFQTLRTYAYQ